VIFGGVQAVHASVDVQIGDAISGLDNCCGIGAPAGYTTATNPTDLVR
jgi:hypothetical protein